MRPSITFRSLVVALSFFPFVLLSQSLVITGPGTVCNGSTITLYGNGIPPANQSPWSSSDINKATISNSGVVAGISPGTVTITYTDNGGVTATKSITVGGIPPLWGNLGIHGYCQSLGTTTLPYSSNPPDSAYTIKYYSSDLSPLIPNPTSLTVDLTTPVNDTFYISQVSSLGCIGPQMSVVTIVSETPAAPITQDLNYCQFDSPIPALTAQFGSVNLNGSSTLQWFNSSQNAISSAPVPPTSIVNTNTWYVRQIDDVPIGQTCAGPKSSINVTTHLSPSTPTATQTNFTYCIGEVATQLSAIADPGHELIWYDALGNILLTAPIPNTTSIGTTKYYVSQKNILAANCESNTIEFTITVLDKAATPVYNGVLPIEYCEGDPVSPIPVTYTTPGYEKWFYSDGTITPGNGAPPNITTTPSDVGTHIYKVIRVPYASTLCESDTLSITIIIHPKPVVTTSSESICFGASVLLEAFGANTYTWSGGLASGNSTLASPQTTTTYLVTGTDVNQCQNTASATVTVLPLPSPPSSSYSNNTVVLCQGPGTFVPSVTNDGSNQLTWYESSGALTPNNGSAPIISKSSTGTYTYAVSQTNSDGCESDKIQITVNIVALPPSPVTTNLSYCQGFSSPVWNLTPIGGTTLQWYDSDGVTQLTNAPSINTNIVGTTTYFVSHKTTNCESPLASISVSVLAPPAPPTANPTSHMYCFEESANVLTASANSNHFLTWYNGSTALSGAPTPSTSTAGNFTYSVTQTDPQGCESAKTDILVIVHPKVDLPTASLANTYEYCQNDQTFTLNANTTSPVNNLVFYNSDGTKTDGNGAPPTPSSVNPGTTQYYVVQLSPSTGCESDPLNLDVDILALPTITTTAAITSCVGDAVILNGAGAGINGTYSWTGGVTDGVSFVPAFSNTSTTYTVTGTDINGCQNNATATVTVNDLPVSPVVNTTSYSYCKDATALPLQANVAFNHALKWYDTDGTTLLSAPFTPPTNITGTFIYYVSQVSNLTDCESLPVAITVTVGVDIPKPITSDRILCLGDPSTQLTATLLPGNTASWYGPNGSPIAFAPIYSTNTAGTTSYYVSQYDPVSQCQSQKDTIDVIVNPLPNVSAGADLSVCEGESVTLVGSGAGTSATYSWSGSITDGTTFIPNTTTTYTVTGTDGNGCEGFDDMTVTVNPIPLSPNVDPSSPTTFITGSLSSVLSATPLSGHSLIWYNSDGSLVNGDGTAPTPSTSVSNVGITNYFVSQINDVTGCESPTLNIQIIILGVGVSNDTLICRTDTAKLMVNTFGAIGGSTSLSYLWSTGQTSSTINVNPSLDTKYWVAISDGNNTWYDTVDVTVNLLDITITQTDTILCAGDSSGTLGVAINPGYGPYSYLWNTGDISDSLKNISVGTYSVVVTDAMGCAADDAITIVQPNNMVVTTQSITNFNGYDISCNGANDGAAFTSVAGGTPGYSYSWSNGGASDTLTSMAAGTYFVTVIDSNGCSSQDTITITEPSPLSLSVSTLTNVFGNQIDCYGDSSGVLFSALAGGVGIYTYSWNTGASQDSIYNLGAGTYWVTAQDANGCTLTDTITLTQPSLPFTTTASTQSNFNGFGISCNGAKDGIISVVVQGSNAPYSYAWSNGATTSSQSNLGQGTYSVVVTDSLGCISNANVVITEPSLLTYSYIIDDVSCYLGQNGSIEIIPQGGVMPYDIQWFNGADSTVLDSLGSGFYTFNLTDQNNCLVIDSVEIYEPAEIEITVDTIQPTCERINDGLIDAIIYGGTYPYSYTLNGSPVDLPLDSVAVGSYILTVADSNSCTETIAFDLVPLQPSCFMIPNMYSPNFDGYNDEFRIRHGSWSSYTLTIYNSIGQLVYSGTSSTPYWDGISNGDPMPTGDYYYQLITNEGEVIYGYVTLIR
ncbi:MAG: gliding motility-associated C-terminal domain-containing protein [Bacteroidetes bacterium]|nr:gliding motility-associated C-terminal domain-containing protein [Bacteroidota bacterium]